MTRCALVLIVIAVFGGCHPVETRSMSEPEYLNSRANAKSPLPFSEAVRVGHLLFLSGTIGNIPGTLELAPGGIEGETRQALENIQATLERFDSSMDRVVKCTVFLADMAEWSRMNEVYVQFFPGPKPARSALGTNGLALGARVEIECIATVDGEETS